MKHTICILLLSTLCILAQGADNLRLETVVIDAGHGGKDPGAVSADGKNYEKTFVLDIAVRLAAKITAAYPDVNVVLTRTRDEFVELADRAGRANKANANLFISIHVNSTKSSSPNGYSVHILGQSSNKNRDLFAYNLDVCKQENSVISLEDDSTQYADFADDPESQIFAVLMQSAYQEQSLKFAETVSRKLAGGPIRADRGIWQNPFIVLWKTSMPAVLVELGFISNATDLAALRQQSGREDLSQRLFEAFKEYKTSYDGVAEDDIEPEADEPAVETPEDKVDVPAAEEPKAKSPSPMVKEMKDVKVQYGIQIFAVSRDIPSGSSEFMGYEPLVVDAGLLKKYIICVSDSLEPARKKLSTVKKKYPQAFLVKISSGKTELQK